MIKNFSIFLLAATLFAASPAFAQGTVAITGHVTDIIDGRPLPGATVKIPGTDTGTATDVEGNFSMKAAAGATIQISFIGYETYVYTLPPATEEAVINAALTEDALALADVTVTSSVAISRRTPVAVSSIGSAFIDEKIGGQDFPEVLRHTPGVHATRKGGGFGDSELRLRGFKQENVAVMVNGVPMNDMEHGGVYWSNWAGLADVARSVQVQRGLGAAKVSAPSIGGSVNIITAGIETEAGGFASYETGDHGFNKMTFKVSSGLTDNDWSLTLLGGKSWGDGYVQGTEFESYNWFVNVSRRINRNHRLSLTAFGAPQRHNQRNRNDGLTLEWWERVREYMGEESAYRYNPSYGFGIGGERKTSARNVYHKPQISLNHLWTIGEKSSLSTALYASYGRGYGYSGQGNLRSRWYGTYNGALNTGQFRHADGTFAYDSVYAVNARSAAGAQMAMSKSVNEHDWEGLISTFTTKFGERVDFYGGIDLRYYKGMHSNVLIDSYGAEYFLDSYARSSVRPENNAAAAAGSEWVNQRLYAGDIVYRDYDSYTGQEGVFAQAEYNYDRLSAFVAGSVSNSSYERFDRFYYDGTHGYSKEEKFIGFTAKGGANYNLGARHNVFASAGYISRAPFFAGGVFLSADVSNVTNPDAVNEKIFSMELGYGFTGRLLNAKLNAYRTVWSDKTMTKLTFAGSDYVVLNMAGVQAKHEGIELDVAASPLWWLDITGMLSVGSWQWQNTATGYFYTSTGQPVASVNGQTIELADGIGAANHASATLELDGVKVGGSAQTTAALGVKVKPMKGLYLGVDYLLLDRNYADWSFAANDLSYNGVKKYESPWEMPSAGLFDLSAGYRFELRGLNVTLSGNVFNLFDKAYIADATDGADHNAETAYGIFYGFGRTGSVKLKIDF